ncbi:hypothetical protein BN2476_1590012 [Paraburkholderia piptadeniae]|uniref:Uncharacterized protein n=1 Tax=Paraburkholderia piptadeniae TaxID=1701573 RepID=A0A1N7SWW5_9BURK|nr:hypothetical protein BN2476_1590012 [Paraburkholderia piptadeniae]
MLTALPAGTDESHARVLLADGTCIVGLRVYTEYVSSMSHPDMDFGPPLGGLLLERWFSVGTRRENLCGAPKCP